MLFEKQQRFADAVEGCFGFGLLAEVGLLEQGGGFEQ
jgi:hypothetical protein